MHTASRNTGEKWERRLQSRVFSGLSGLPLDTERVQNQAVTLGEAGTLGNNLVCVEHGGILRCAPACVIENAVAKLAGGIGTGSFRVKDGTEVIHGLIPFPNNGS